MKKSVTIFRWIVILLALAFLLFGPSKSSAQDPVDEFWEYYETTTITFDDIAIECEKTGLIPTYSDLIEYVTLTCGYVPMWIDENGSLYYHPDGQYWEKLIDIFKTLELIKK